MNRLKLSRRYFRTGKPIKNAQPTPEQYLFWREFDDYQKKNYSTIPVQCLCGKDDSYLISNVDREGFEYPLVICRACGLISKGEYWDQNSTSDYYENWYRKLYGKNQEDAMGAGGCTLLLR